MLPLPSSSGEYCTLNRDAAHTGRTEPKRRTRFLLSQNPLSVHYRYNHSRLTPPEGPLKTLIEMGKHKARSVREVASEAMLDATEQAAASEADAAVAPPPPPRRSGRPASAPAPQAEHSAAVTRDEAFIWSVQAKLNQEMIAKTRSACAHCGTMDPAAAAAAAAAATTSTAATAAAASAVAGESSGEASAAATPKLSSCSRCQLVK